MRAGALEVFKIFSSILDEKQAEQVVDYISDVNETEMVSYIESKIDHLATKEDLTILKYDLEFKIAQIKADLEVKIAQTDIKIAQIKAVLETKIAQTKAELIKWMFIFWITQMLSILGVLIYFLK